MFGICGLTTQLICANEAQRNERQMERSVMRHLKNRVMREADMNIKELKPRWIGDANGHHDGVKFGITFKCPHCDIRIGVLFDPPIGNLNEGALWAIPIGKRWFRSGDSLDTLSLTPSINVDGHWHGFITAGEILDA